MINKPSRIIYTPKASREERNRGLEGFEEKEQPHSTNMKCENCGLPVLSGTGESCKCGNKKEIRNKVANHHPTVKPLKLMEYLCLLTKTPTGGIVLDPFGGSGTTGMACKLTGRKYILIEKEKEYCEIAEARIKATPTPLL